MYVSKCISCANFKFERFVVPVILMVAILFYSTFGENCKKCLISSLVKPINSNIVIVHVLLHHKRTMDFFVIGLVISLIFAVCRTLRKENAHVLSCQFSFEPMESMEKGEKSKTIGAYTCLPVRQFFG